MRKHKDKLISIIDFKALHQFFLNMYQMKKNPLNILHLATIVFVVKALCLNEIAAFCVWCIESSELLLSTTQLLSTTLAKSTQICEFIDFLANLRD
jgi:hypothetical protein